MFITSYHCLADGGYWNCHGAVFLKPTVWDQTEHRAGTRMAFGFGVLSGVLGGQFDLVPTVAMYLVARDVNKDALSGPQVPVFGRCLPLGAGQLVAGILTGPH